MNLYALELNNDLKGVPQRKAYIEALIQGLESPGFVALPELALCSYIGNETVWQYADEGGRDTAAWATAVAEKYNTCIGVGYLEKRGQDYYNAYMVAGKGGVYGTVRKGEGEAAIFKRGNFGNIIETPMGNIAVGICYDSRRKQLYDNIKDRELSLVLFPHGCPSNPKRAAEEVQTIHLLCTTYLNAFGVPVVYINSRGRLAPMPGNTGRLMAANGFSLNGMTQIFSENGILIESGPAEATGMQLALTPGRRKQAIRFYGKDLIKGNRLFRLLVLRPDIYAGVRYYERNKP